MSFNPNLPIDGSLLDAGVMRSQFNGLNARIEAIVTITSAQIDAVHTLGPGQPANVTVNVSSGTLHFVFDIPQGPEGPMGPQGPAFADATVDSVTTLDPGQPATVTVNFAGATVHFDFGIPRGEQGAGGPQGPQGEQGTQGPPGDVSTQQLNDAIATTAQNPSGIGPFTGSFSDPPTQAEMEAFAAYVESLRMALMR